MHVVYIAIGGNIGDKKSNCQNAVNALSNPRIAILKAKSKFYQTEPLDYLDQDWFINMAVKIETLLDPFSLFQEIKEIEKKIGRVDNKIRFGPRKIDLDIILYDDLIMNTDDLIIPHPRMHKRRFVLEPMCDIALYKIHPILKKSMYDLLNQIDNEQKVFLA